MDQFIVLRMFLNVLNAGILDAIRTDAQTKDLNQWSVCNVESQASESEFKGNHVMKKSIIVAQVFVSLLIFACASEDDYTKKLETERNNNHQYNLNILRNYWKLANWDYLDDKSYIITKKTAFENNYLSRNNLFGGLEEEIMEPVGFVMQEKGFKTIDRAEFDKLIERVSKKYDGIDPFDAEKFKQSDNVILKSNVYAVLNIPFDITNYNLAKETLNISFNRTSGHSSLSSVFNYMYVSNFCPDIINITQIHIGREVAEKFRGTGEFSSKKGRVILHSKLLPIKKVSKLVNNCVRQNQFAKDGCLEWEKTLVVYQITPIEIIAVDLMLVGGPWLEQSDSRTDKVTVSAESLFHERLKKTVKFECN